MDAWQHFVRRKSYGLCVILDAHVFLTLDKSIRNEYTADFSLYITGTPFMGGFRDFLALSELATGRDSLTQRRKDGMIAVSRTMKVLRDTTLDESNRKKSIHDLLKMASQWMRISGSKVSADEDFPYQNGLVEVDWIQSQEYKISEDTSEDTLYALNTVKEAYKLTWLFANQTLHVALMESSINLNGKMQNDPNFLGTRNRLRLAALGTTTWLDEEFLPLVFPSTEGDGHHPAVIFVNFPIQAWYIKKVSKVHLIDISSKAKLPQMVETKGQKKGKDFNVWTITERMSDIPQAQAYTDWSEAIQNDEVAILVVTYKVGAHVWDFSDAEICIFAQQPWVPGWQTNCLGRFYDAKAPRDNKLNVIDLDPHRGINFLVKQLWANGFKVRDGFMRLYIQKMIKSGTAEGDDVPGLDIKNIYGEYMSKAKLK